MLVGYNNNITYKGKGYHVQTEDSGLKNPIIVTLLFYKGTILASKKINYSHLIDKPDVQKNVREMMKEQHKTMLKELIAGKHTSVAEAETNLRQKEECRPTIESAVTTDSVKQPVIGKKKDIKKTLDDILLDYIMEREKKI
ncbi:MAG: hypothetical protein HY755_04285 [Nitrospirae bacterium]|nr:hypothetical protein [Nitrospirota bacterium]